MVRFVVLTFAWILTTINLPGMFSQTLSEVNSGSNNCTSTTVPKHYLDVYSGWPNKIICFLLFVGEEYNLYDAYDDDGDEPVVCKVWDHNQTLVYEVNTTYTTLENDERSREYGYLLPANNNMTDFRITIIFPQKVNCLTAKLHLNYSEFQQISCQDFIESQRLVYTPSSLQSTKALSCDPEVRMFPKLDVTNEMTYQWERNCSVPPNHTEGVNSDGITLSSLDFDHAGIYTCSVKYNGMTRFIIAYPICLQHGQSINKQSLTCNHNRVYALLGEDVVFTCKANFGQGTVNIHGVSIKWNKVEKNGTKELPTQCDFKPQDKKDSRMNCTLRTNSENVCFLHIANDVERTVPEATVSVKLTISNVQAEDYGVYLISAYTNLESSETIYHEIKLEPNDIPRLLTQAQLAGLCIGILFVILILLGIAFYYRIYIRVYYKRYVIAYVVDDKKYGAFFAYRYSKDIDAFAQDDVKNFVSQLHFVLEELGFHVYDEQRDGFSYENRAENVRISIENSHRLIILLTLDFIKDGWSMFALQKGFDDMIQSGSKIIFILLPGMKEYLKQHCMQNDTCRMIQRAMKLNYTLEWSNEKKQKRFKLEIEDAMPKLKPRRFTREISTSSYGNMSLNGFREYDFKRCFSNDTDITEIDVPQKQETNGDILRIIDDQSCDAKNTSV